jgi:hypothetical protein
MDRISKKLGGKNIHGIRFDVYTFKKRKENKVGADLLGLLEIEIGGKRITKAYLAQAKVGITYQDSENGEVYAKCYDSLLQKKCQICLI